MATEYANDDNLRDIFARNRENLKDVPERVRREARLPEITIVDMPKRAKQSKGDDLEVNLARYRAIAAADARIVAAAREWFRTLDVATGLMVRNELWAAIVEREALEGGADGE